MTTYDHITNQFAPDLSPLARRMYAAIYEATSRLEKDTIQAYEISAMLRESDSHEGALCWNDLIRSGLIEHAPGGFFRYRLTSDAWRAHLLHERSLKEQAFQALESTERALARCIDESDEQAPSALGNCANCGIELNNVTTGMVVVHRENRHITVCGPCADSLVARKLYTIIAQARSLTAESAAALLRDAVDGRR